MQIIWSEDALQDYHQNIDYLLSRWSVKSAQLFIEEADSILEILEISPKAFPISDYNSVRRAVIQKQITLFYKIEVDIVYLVRFWNTYQNPESLRI